MPGQRDSRQPASPPPGRTGRPRSTSRAEILAAARRVIDEDGWETLTVRRLAAEIGVGTTTLYHHVHNKDDLVVELVNQHLGQLDRPELPDDPRERIVIAATTMHDALAAWPWAAEALTADGFLGRLGDSALWIVETIVAGAVDSGCTREQAVDVFRSIWYYTVGEVLVRARSDRRRADVGAADLAFGLRRLDPSRQPQLAAIGALWPERSALDLYPQVLRIIVDGLLAEAGRTA
ncbi:TetR/AcrR family transcriptional regulator [Streptomyces sp. WMMC500]|uniref:TetR/AcrR family transcriptional regulator n=1 Tax=Streptomyces sp. WMMC500 TaxID=3015154 RepID=UPI00248CC904|nr:TetR/AcrR family transcriptional regulator [Streptomyces sp. WMMC500]WBB58701.1 TetR/AcrR family transcriptional regulator [Streptomyces sp. WMMC500]